MRLSQYFDVSLNRTIRALGINRSTVFYKKRGYPKRKKYRRKELSSRCKEAIQTIAKTESTYGVPRVRALIKRDFGVTASKHLVHRYMQEEGLLICRPKGERKSRKHTGQVMVATPNTRWASDITSIKCWNGEKVRLAVVIDCCDRSIISWRAGRRMQASDIELMVQDALFERFGEKLPEKDTLQFLHDNGPEFIEGKLQKSLNDWNITNCNTPTYSPQSNGLCEAFNGTLKRDYVYESCLDDFETVEKQIEGWINKYNTFAPHSSLEMKTPQEFYKLKSAA